MAYRHTSPLVDSSRIRELRIRSGLSVTGLARLIGITPQYLSQIEHGHRPTVSPATFAKIRMALRVGDQETLQVEDAA